MKRINIRCCCRPEKIIGSIPDNGYKEGDVIAFPKSSLELQYFNTVPMKTAIHLLKVRRYIENFHTRVYEELAIVADGLAAEDFKSIADFTEEGVDIKRLENLVSL